MLISEGITMLQTILDKLFPEKRFPDMEIDLVYFNVAAIDRVGNKTIILVKDGDSPLLDEYEFHCSLSKHNQLVSRIRALKGL